MTYRMAANAIWNKLNIVMTGLVNDGVKPESETVKILLEARALAESIVQQPESGKQPNCVRCVVKFPHVREINGQTLMLEPLLSGILTLPDDEDTKLSLKRKWLEVVA
jgi:hypothetical protein